MQRKHAWRYLAIAVFFCLVCVIYLGRLFYIQIAGKDAGYGEGTTVRTVTVQAVRGHIYDRNGKPIVTNSYSYDLKLDYTAFSSMSAVRGNEVCLTLLDLLSAGGEGDKHTESFFPFEGAYPYYSWSAAVTAGDSLEYYRLQRVLSDLNFEADTSPKTLVEYYVDTYDLLATDSKGVRRFNDDEIDRLLRLRYDMDALRFGVASDYTVARDVSLSLMTSVKEQGFGGVTFLGNVKRVYAYPGYASHIIGAVGPIYAEEWEYYNEQGYQMNAVVGKSGCELAFEEYLHGSDGKLRIEEDSVGNIISVTVIKEPIPGNDVYLTIDMDLQMAAEDGLAENVEFVSNRSQGILTMGGGCDAGAAVAMDPDTFEVLAMASYPTYDMTTYNLLYNELLEREDNPLQNRAIEEIYSPGSTYKLGVAAAGLLSDEAGITTSSIIKCDGVYDRLHHPKCSTQDRHSSGFLNVVEAIADSCNCFFYELGYRMGIDRLNEYMSAFGFGQPTGIELYGESKGILAGPSYRQEIHGELWAVGDVLSAAIGQSDNKATPLQLACYLATLSNGGTRYRAQLLKEVRSPLQEAPVFSYLQSEEDVLSRIEIPQAALDAILQGMREMVTTHDRANRNFASVPVKVGGKTGTAQNSASLSGTGSENALFVCAAPYDDPEIVLSVVLEEGYIGEYASLTAARILERYYGVTQNGDNAVG